MEQFGRYLLLEKIAKGGMAEVFRAAAVGSAGFSKMVAIKRILPHLAEEQAFVAMLVDEAKIAATLNHPNILQVLDLGEHQGQHFIAMEFVVGRSLDVIIGTAAKAGFRLPQEFGSYVVAQALHGLHYAHTKTDPFGQPCGIIHRDISPQNIMVGYDGSVKLADFGIARAADRTTHTQTGTIKGKPGYMSPEQVLNKAIDQRLDLYAMGVVLHEALTMRRMRRAESDVHVLMAVANGEFPRFEDMGVSVPDVLARVVYRALEPDPKNRWQDANAFALALQGVSREKGWHYAGTEVSQVMRKLFPLEMENERQAQANFANVVREFVPSANPAPSLPPPVPAGGTSFAIDISLGTGTVTRPPGPLPTVVTPHAGVQLPNMPPPPVNDVGSSAVMTVVPVTSLPTPARPGEAVVTNPGTPASGVFMPPATVPLAPRTSSSSQLPVTAPEARVPTQPGLAAVRADMGGGPSLGGMSSLAELETDVVPLSAAQVKRPARASGPPVGGIVAAALAVGGLAVGGWWFTRPAPAGPQATLAPAPAPSAPTAPPLVVETTPPGARVTVGGREQPGVTPLIIRDLPIGPVEIEAVLDGMEPAKRVVNLTTAESPAVKIALAAVPRAVEVVTAPPGAEVFVNGALKGTTPTSVSLVPGKAATLRLALVGYKAVERKVTPGDAPPRLEFVLEAAPDEPAPGKGRPAPARKPAPTPAPSPAPVAEKPAPAPAPAPVAEKPAPAPVDNTPGKLTVVSRPWAAIFLDGKDTGKFTPVMNMEVPPGKHTLKLVNTEHNLSATVNVELAPGQSVNVTRELKQ